MWLDPASLVRSTGKDNEHAQDRASIFLGILVGALQNAVCNI